MITLLLAALAASQSSEVSQGALVEVRAKFVVVSTKDESAPKVMFPLPLDYRGQVPLSFELKAKGKGTLVGSRTYSEDGNRVVELSLKPLKRAEVVEIEWISLVMTEENESFDSVPKSVAFAETYPREVGAWLRPSMFVQSDDPRISAVAREVRGGDVMETIRKTIDRCLKITNAAMMRQRCTELSAVQALDRSGSCTSNANLMAAVLRANGIPARVLSGYPTWAGRPYQTHYIVEAYVAGFGWYPIEPTTGQIGVSCRQMPLVSIVPVRNEYKGQKRPNGFGGVPFLSLTEASADVYVRGNFDKTRASDHEAKVIGQEKLSDGFWADARARWAEWLRQSETGVRELRRGSGPMSFAHHRG